MGSKLVIGWKVASLNPNIASVRYRAVLPSIALESDAIQSKIFSRPSLANLRGIDVLVIVKSLTEEDLFLAEEAKQRGIPIVLDLCDNIFVPGYQGKKKVPPADIFVAMTKHAVAVTTTTEPLAEVIRGAIGAQPRVFVIPDGIESLSDAHANHSLWWGRLRELVENSWAAPRRKHIARNVAKVVCTSSLWGLAIRGQGIRRGIKEVKRQIQKRAHWRYWAKLAYKRFDSLRRKLRRNLPRADSLPTERPAPKPASIKRILWFGNQGAPYARFGILDLLEIRNALERIAAEIPVELWVVSNNRAKYEKDILPLAITSRYVKWSPGAMKLAFSNADVVVVPNTGDPFSICKSANRTTLALSHGVPVVATYSPALKLLTDCIEISDFYAGLKRYLTEPVHVDRHLGLAAKIIEANFGRGAIAAAWTDVLSYVRGQNVSIAEDDFQVIVCLHLIQDLDLAKPVLERLLQKGIRCQVWLSVSLMRKSPRVLEALRQLGAEWKVLPDSYPESRHFHFPASAKAVLAVAETNLGPHRFTHQILRRANKAGMATFGMQHGFENVGLTYTDNVHAIERIEFAAKHIFIWGKTDALHPECTARTISRCISVGCPKPAYQATPPELKDILQRDNKIIGIFENLHWHRYSDAYREFFLECVYQLAEEFEEYLFLVKPHHAGMWLTSKFKGKKLDSPNLLIADPASAVWERFTAGQLLGFLDAVITTPSTVALDAARMHLPVTVVGYDLDLGCYEPLKVVSTNDQLRKFVKSLNEKADRDQLIELSRRFVNGTLLSGDAVSRIVTHIARAIDFGEPSNGQLATGPLRVREKHYGSQ